MLKEGRRIINITYKWYIERGIADLLCFVTHNSTEELQAKEVTQSQR